jgi:predicted RNA-binding protein with EMAP domain
MKVLTVYIKNTGGATLENVSKDSCEKEHKRVDENMDRTEKRLNSHSGEIHDIKEAVLKLTIMVEAIGKKSVFDKILIISVFMMGVVLVAVVLGPELAGKFVGGAVK